MSDLYARTLKRAAEIVGGEQELALKLNATPSHLALWIRGMETPSANIFLRAVDIVSEHDLSQVPVRQPPGAEAGKGGGNLGA